MRLFHYHLVTSEARDLEARYLGRLGFRLLGRHGRVADDYVTSEPGTSWEELDRLGFSLRLSELERGAVSVVIQPGRWRFPRVDHLGLALDEDEFEAVLDRAAGSNLPVQERGGRRTLISTNSGYRIEIHPPRDWIDQLFDESDELELAELKLRTDRPEQQAATLGDILGVDARADSVYIGETVIRFVPGGPEGRPELDAERFR